MRYEVPASVAAAVDLLATPDARVLAGGTDLLVQLRAGRTKPATLVDIKKIPELKQIHLEPDLIRIGAAVSGAELGEHATISKEWPGVVEAFELIGSTQVQGRASLGGNLCNASPAADSVPALIAAAAVCLIAGPGGQRSVPVEEIITGPGKTSLQTGEFVLEIQLPRQLPHSGDAYLRLIPRTEMDIAVVGAGVNLTLDDNGICTAARVALGAVAPRPLLVAEAAAALCGSRLDEAALEQAAAAARNACQPINDKRGTVDYRINVAGVLVKRAARIAQQRAQQRTSRGH